MSGAEGTRPAQIVSDVIGKLRSAKRSRLGQAVASVGLASRAIVYGSLTVLVLALAFTRRPNNTDQGSALADLDTISGGAVLLVALLIGVACYTLWRWTEAITGPADGDHSVRNRVQAAVEGAAYLPFGYLAVAILVGDPAKAQQGRRYRSLSASVLRSGWGVAAVVLVGLIVVGVGLFFVYQGARRTFAAHFDFPSHRPYVQPAVLTLGVLGSIGRGVIFAEAGVLVVYGAVAHQPARTGGLDSALDTLARQTFGTVLLLAAAAGFAAFALFAVAEAIWRDR